MKPTLIVAASDRKSVLECHKVDEKEHFIEGNFIKTQYNSCGNVA